MYAEDLVKLIRSNATYKGTSIAEKQLWNGGVNAACKVVEANLEAAPVAKVEAKKKKEE